MPRDGTPSLRNSAPTAKSLPRRCTSAYSTWPPTLGVVLVLRRRARANRRKSCLWLQAKKGMDEVDNALDLLQRMVEQTIRFSRAQRAASNVVAIAPSGLKSTSV